MTGPIAPVIAEKPDHVPIARPRSAPVKLALMSASDSGIAHAAPMPCTQRAAIRTSTLGASTQPTEASAKIDDPDDEQPLAPVEVAERSAEQDQRREEQRVAFDDPLHLRRVRAQLALDHRQRDVHRRAVDERHRRSENRRDEHPGLRHPTSIGYSDAMALLPRRTRMSEIAWLGSLDDALKAAQNGERLVLMDVFNPG